MFQVIAVAQVMNKQGATLNHAFTKEDEKVFMKHCITSSLNPMGENSKNARSHDLFLIFKIETLINSHITYYGFYF